MGIHGHFSLQVYPYHLVFSLGDEDDVYIPWIKKIVPEVKEELDDEDLKLRPSQGGRCTILPSGDTIIRLRRIPVTPRDRGVLGHEIFHAASMLLGRIGMSLTFESDEAYAYLIGYITERIETSVAKHLKCT